MEAVIQKKQCVIASINEKYVPFFSVLLESIIENSGDTGRYEVVVLYNQLSPESREKLEGMLRQSNIQLRFLKVSSWIKGRNFFVNGENQKEYLSKEAYFRLLAPELLPEYETALYLDSDIVVQPGWDDIFKTDLKKHLLAAVPDIWDNWKCYLPHSSLAKYRERELGMDNHKEYFNSGVMLLNLKAMRSFFKEGELLELAASKDWKKHDQDVINLMCRKKALLLDYKWNLIESPGKEAYAAISDEERSMLYKSQEEKKIIHFASRKPWNARGVQNEDEFWKFAVKSPFFDELFSLFVDEQLQQGRYFEETVFKNIRNGRVGIKFIIRCTIVWLRNIFNK